jgi:hypothetical protein
MANVRAPSRAARVKRLIDRHAAAIDALPEAWEIAIYGGTDTMAIDLKAKHSKVGLVELELAEASA